MKIPILPGFQASSFKKYLLNTGWIMGARVGSIVIKTIVSVFALPNYLGASGNGILHYPLVLVTFFTAASALGLDSFVTRELLVTPEKNGKILGTAFFLRLIAGLICIPLIFLTYFIICEIAPTPPATPFTYIAIVSTLCVSQAIHIIDCFFQAKVMGKVSLYAQVGANLLSAGIKLTLIYFQAPISIFIWSLALDGVILAVFYTTLYQRVSPGLKHWTFDWQLGKNLLKKSWPLAFSSLAILIYMKIDQLMIEAYLGENTLGIYTTVVQLSEGWYFIPMALVTALFPAIMHARKENIPLYEKRMQQLYQLMSIIGIALALFTTIAAPYVYQYLFKPEYYTATPILQIHVWGSVFMFLYVASGQYLIAEGYTNLALIRSVLGMVCNISLNLIWIPKHGMAGAAYATIITYMCSALFIVFVPKTRNQGLMLLKALFFIPILQKYIFISKR